ncbi:hypothetical protein C8Q74DRAFT_559043 [Fomes fomentarius]|nr:hypothetical protein C8Q74DRAFT_559043 [Fomes fomentarius]
MPRAPRKTTYADRTLYKLCVRDFGTFDPEDFVDEVLDDMVERGEKLTRMSRSWVEKHLSYLKRCHLVKRDKENRDRLLPVDPLAAEIKKIRRRMPELTPAMLKDVAILVRIGAYPKKRITAKELRKKYDELQDTLEDVEEDRDEWKTQCAKLKEEREAFEEMCAALEAELQAARDGHPQIDPHIQPEHVQEDAMDVDTEDPADTSTDASGFQRQHTAATLRRTPTLDYIDPVTPARNPSGSSNGSQSLPTPPNSDERPRKRVARTASQRSQRSSISRQDTQLHARGNSPLAGPTRARPSTPGRRERSLSQDSEFSAEGEDHLANFAKFRKTIRRAVDKFEADTTRERERSAQREKKLLERAEQAQQEAATLIAQIERHEATLADYRQHHFRRTQECMRLRFMGDSLQARVSELEDQVARLAAESQDKSVALQQAQARVCELVQKVQSFAANLAESFL